MKERLIEFLKAHNMTSTRLADEIGVQRSSISHIISGRNNPSYDFIHKFLKYYSEINPKWLILGEGSMYVKEKQTSMAFEQQAEQPASQETAIEKETKDEVHRKKFQPDAERTIQSTHIEKIVIFYSDNRFEEYVPREKK